MNAVDELAKARGLVGACVAYKVNARGEHVVAFHLLVVPAAVIP
jgi:hypothetical protein